MAIPDCDTCQCRVGCFSCQLRDVKCPGIGDCGTITITLAPCPTDICAFVKTGIPFVQWPKDVQTMLEEMCERWEYSE